MLALPGYCLLSQNATKYIISNIPIDSASLQKLAINFLMYGKPDKHCGIENLRETKKENIYTTRNQLCESKR